MAGFALLAMGGIARTTGIISDSPSVEHKCHDSGHVDGGNPLAQGSEVQSFADFDPLLSHLSAPLARRIVELLI